MGFIFGILNRIIKFFIYIAVVIAIILLIPNLPPYTKFTSIEIDATQSRTGALAPNHDLNNVEKLYTDKLLGPEAFQLWNGELYTSLATGEIVKISHGGHVTFVTQIGQPCTGLVQEHICGRPLGFVIDDKTKQMYVADAYLGIWRVDLKSYKKQLLVSPRVEIEGRKPKLFNSVALAGNGDLYWTDSSSDYNLKDGAYAIVSDPSGRFFRYNPAKNESSVLLDDLWFPNGIIVSPDNQFVLIAETNHMRILKYYIDGPKKGTKEVFVTGLPGTPDTIRVLPDGSGVIVALYAAFDDEHPLLLKSLASTPMARKFAARFMRLLELPFEFVNNHFPNYIFEQVTYTIGHFATISGFGPGLSGIVQIDWNGNIVASHYNTDHSIYHISDAIVYNDKLYLGCPHMQNFIGAVPVPPLLKKAFYVAKPTPPKDKPASQQKNTQKEKKPIADQQKQKIDKPIEKKPTQKTSTEKPPSTQGDKVKTVPPKQPEVKNAIPKEPVKPVKVDKEDVPKSSPKVKETKPKQEATPESAKPTTGATPKPATTTETKPRQEATPETTTPKTADAPKPAKTETTSEPKKIADSKPKEATNKVEVKKEAVKEQKVVPESKPNAVPKEEPKKEAPVKPKIVKSEKSEKPSTEKPASKAETPNAKTPKQPKSDKKAAKDPVEDEPQIIVQRLSPEEKRARKPIEGEPQIIVKKVVPDEIPVNEEIPSDTIKPKGEPLKVIKKNGPIEIPTNV